MLFFFVQFIYLAFLYVNAIDDHSNQNIETLCTDPDAKNVHYLLYTRQTGSNSIDLNDGNYQILNSRNKTIIIVHGWQSHHNSYNLPLLRQTYLQRYDANVIALDWCKEASDPYYTISACKALKVGILLAQFLCVSEIPPNNVHILGHSMGSHLSGSAGKYTKKVCNRTIDRITGLDPGGNIFSRVSSHQRLDAEDANFVDVLHTMELIWSFYGNIGTVDFHVNCGIFQPACIVNPFDIAPPLQTPLCSHIIVIDYMIESINSKDFIGTSCSTCPYQCNVDNHSEYVVMGESVSRSTKKTVFYVPVRDRPPYGLGTTHVNI